MKVAETESQSQEVLTQTEVAREKIPVDPSFTRLINLLRKVCAKYYASGRGVPVDVRWRDEKPFRFGHGEPAFTITLNDKTGVSAFASLDGLAFVESYVLGHMDITGDM